VLIASLSAFDPKADASTTNIQVEGLCRCHGNVLSKPPRYPSIYVYLNADLLLAFVLLRLPYFRDAKPSIPPPDRGLLFCERSV
jgi:hypothetical protein